MYYSTVLLHVLLLVYCKLLLKNPDFALWSLPDRLESQWDGLLHLAGPCTIIQIAIFDQVRVQDRSWPQSTVSKDVRVAWRSVHDFFWGSMLMLGILISQLLELDYFLTVLGSFWTNLESIWQQLFGHTGKGPVRLPYKTVWYQPYDKILEFKFWILW